MDNSALNDSVDTILQHTRGRDYKERIAFLNLFADVENILSKHFDIKMTEPIPSSKYSNLSSVFKGLQIFSLHDVNILLKAISFFRNTCAHYMVRHFKYLGDVYSVLNKIGTNVEKLYALYTDDGNISIYGMLIIVSFFVDRPTLHKFLVDVSAKYFSRERLWENIARLEHNLISIGQCPNGDADSATQNPNFALNKILSDNLTGFFFALEEALCCNGQGNQHYKSFNELLRNDIVLSNYSEVNLLVVLRNCWFHGKKLGDTIEYKGKNQFSLVFIFRILAAWTKIFNRLPTVRFNLAINAIKELAQELIAYKYKKMIRLSYELFGVSKIIPYTIEKLVGELNEEYERLRADKELNDEIISLTFKMANLRNVAIYLEGYNFSDKTSRVLRGRYIRFVRVKSQSPLTIRDTVVNSCELTYVVPTKGDTLYYGYINSLKPNKVNYDDCLTVNKVEQLKEVEV